MNSVKVMQLCNYSAPYAGNFIESLKAINQYSQYCNVYVFPKAARRVCKNWFQVNKDTDNKVYCLPSSFWLINLLFIYKICAKNNICLIHMHFWGTRHFIYMKIFSFMCRIPIVIHFHNLFTYNYLKKFLSSIALRNFILIGCSDITTNTLKQHFKECVIYNVPNGINFKRLHTSMFMQPSNESNNFYKVCAFGRPFFQKGMDVILDAIKQIVTGGTRIKLYIVFSVNQEFYKHLILKHLDSKTWPHWIQLLTPTNSISNYLTKMDCFVSSSREETFCYAIAEAAYCGCQVIASDIPGHKSHEKMPYIQFFKSEDVDDLKQVLCNTLQHPLSEEKLKKRHAYLKEHYDISLWVKQISQIYDRHIKGI